LKLTFGAAPARDSASESGEVIFVSGIENSFSFATTTSSTARVSAISTTTAATSLGSTLTEVSLVVVLLESESHELSSFVLSFGVHVLASQLVVELLNTDLAILVLFEVLVVGFLVLSSLGLRQVGNLSLGFKVIKSESDFFL